MAKKRQQQKQLEVEGDVSAVSSERDNIIDQLLQEFSSSNTSQIQALIEWQGEFRPYCKLCHVRFTGPENSLVHFNPDLCVSHHARLMYVKRRTNLDIKIGCDICCCEVNTVEVLKIHENSPKHGKKVEAMHNVIKLDNMYNRIRLLFPRSSIIPNPVSIDYFTGAVDPTDHKENIPEKISVSTMTSSQCFPNPNEYLRQSRCSHLAKTSDRSGQNISPVAICGVEVDRVQNSVRDRVTSRVHREIGNFRSTKVVQTDQVTCNDWFTQSLASSSVQSERTVRYADNLRFPPLVSGDFLPFRLGEANGSRYSGRMMGNQEHENDPAYVSPLRRHVPHTNRSEVLDMCMTGLTSDPYMDSLDIPAHHYSRGNPTRNVRPTRNQPHQNSNRNSIGAVSKSSVLDKNVNQLAPENHRPMKC